MNDIIQLIGKNVHSDAKDTLEHLSRFRVEVEEFGADDELPPQYYLSAASGGIQIQHSESGQVQVIFLYGEGESGFSQYRGPLIAGLTLNSSSSEIRKALGDPKFYAPQQTVPGLGSYGELLRYDFLGYSVHFQMKDSGTGLALVTVMAPGQVPGT